MGLHWILELGSTHQVTITCSCIYDARESTTHLINENFLKRPIQIQTQWHYFRGSVHVEQDCERNLRLCCSGRPEACSAAEERVW